MRRNDVDKCSCGRSEYWLSFASAEVIAQKKWCGWWCGLHKGYIQRLPLMKVHTKWALAVKWKHLTESSQSKFLLKCYSRFVLVVNRITHE